MGYLLHYNLINIITKEIEINSVLPIKIKSNRCFIKTLKPYHLH